MIIYLVLLLPAGSSDLPKAWRATFISLLFGLASNGVYMCHCCYQQCGSLLHCLSTLTIAFAMAVYFCCTGLGVASTGRYPASCPVKPGLSSPASFRLCSRDHLADSCVYEPADKPGYVLNGHLSSTDVAASVKRPTLKHGGPPYCLMCGLASDGVYMA